MKSNRRLSDPMRLPNETSGIRFSIEQPKWETAREPSMPTLPRRLIVPLDGSQVAEHAVPYATAIANRSGSTLCLVHVQEPLYSTADPFGYAWSYHRWRRQARMKQYLDNLSQEIHRFTDVRIVTMLAESSNTVESLRSLSRPTDLVVMANYGRNAWGRFIHGSTSRSLLQRATCPVLTVRGHDLPADFAADPISRHVLVPLDGSKSAEQIIRPVRALCRLTDSQVTLAHIRGAATGMSDAHAAVDYLQSLQQRVKDDFSVVDSQLIRSVESVSDAVLALAREQNADLIAVTSRNRSLMSRLFGGSVADRLLRSATAPVLVHRVKE